MCLEEKRITDIFRVLCVIWSAVIISILLKNRIHPNLYLLLDSKKQQLRIISISLFVFNLIDNNVPISKTSQHGSSSETHVSGFVRVWFWVCNNSNRSVTSLRNYNRLNAEPNHGPPELKVQLWKQKLFSIEMHHCAHSD